MMFVCGSGVAKTRCVRVIFLYLPLLAFIKDSNEGVADPRSMGILFCFALIIATFLPE